MYKLMAVEARLPLPPVTNCRVLPTNRDERRDVFLHHHPSNAYTGLDAAEGGTFVPQKVPNVENVTVFGEKLGDLAVGDRVGKIKQAHLDSSILHRNSQLVRFSIKHEFVLVIVLLNDPLSEIEVADLHEGAT